MLTYDELKTRPRQFLALTSLTLKKFGDLLPAFECDCSGIKRSPIVKDILRNTKDRFSDLTMVVACGLHNVRVNQCKKPLKLRPKPYSG